MNSYSRRHSFWCAGAAGLLAMAKSTMFQIGGSNDEDSDAKDTEICL
jgi:hypothetical protein